MQTTPLPTMRGSMDLEAPDAVILRGGGGDLVVPPPPKREIKWGPLLLYMVIMGVGTVGGPLVQRLYYIHGGSRKWLMSFLLSAGSPTIILPIIFSYIKNRAKGEATPVIEPKLVASAIFIGVLYGFDNYMYTAGLEYIPVSTSSLIISTQLAFTAIFAFFFVGHKFTFYSTNAVVLMTFGTVVLALHTSSDRPEGVSKGKYLFGFFSSLGAACLWGFMVPFIERSYRKAKKAVDSNIVMQYQLLMGSAATVVCLVAMGVNNDFEAIPREAREYTIGRTKYWIVLVANAVVWQISFIGTLGVIHYASSLFTGIYISVLFSFSEIAAVIIYKDKFTGEKGMSLALCLWGFISYFLGEYKMSMKWIARRTIIADGV